MWKILYFCVKMEFLRLCGLQFFFTHFSSLDSDKVKRILETKQENCRFCVLFLDLRQMYVCRKTYYSTIEHFYVFDFKAGKFKLKWFFMISSSYLRASPYLVKAVEFCWKENFLSRKYWFNIFKDLSFFSKFFGSYYQPQLKRWLKRLDIFGFF